MGNDAQESERWVLDERKEWGVGWMGVITPHLPFYYLILFIPSLTRK